MAEMLYQGKVKQVWSTDDPDILEFRFTNQISVFDQIIPSLIPRKGESLNRTTAHWFKLIEEEDARSVLTCFSKQIAHILFTTTNIFR